MTMLRYNEGKVPLSLIPTSFVEAIVNQAFEADERVPTKLIWLVGQVLDFGAKKYSAHNWRKGGSWTSVLNSGLRHLYAMLNGRRVDPESQIDEAGHLGCNIAFLLEFMATETGNDDRFVSPRQPVLEGDPEPSLVWVLQALLAFQDGGSIEYLRTAAYELARWVERQGDETPLPTQPAATVTFSAIH